MMNEYGITIVLSFDFRWTNGLLVICKLQSKFVHLTYCSEDFPSPSNEMIKLFFVDKKLSLEAIRPMIILWSRTTVAVVFSRCLTTFPVLIP